MSTVTPNVRTLRKMQVSKVVDHTPLFRELFIETRDPESFEFQAGQFVMLHVPPEAAGTEKPVLRAYSIASDDRNQRGFRLVFKAVETGIATKFVWGLKGGEMLTFTGPFGRVLFKEPPTKQVICLNTGSGISQHYSYFISKGEKYPDVQFRMLFGLRNEEDLYYRAELDELKRRLKNFTYDYVLSQPSVQWTGKRGYVQNFIDEFDYLKIPTTFYLCGNSLMIKETKQKLIEEQGFDKTLVLAEAFD
jgi:CDP-4-dehydro-6-deoxyglucose reductase